MADVAAKVGDDGKRQHPPSAPYRAQFTGKYEYRLIPRRVGHNLPQEAPKAFAKAG
jgi:hypothetical protein